MEQVSGAFVSWYLYTVQAGYIAAAEGSIFTITRLAGGELSVDLAVAPH